MRLSRNLWVIILICLLLWWILLVQTNPFNNNTPDQEQSWHFPGTIKIGHLVALDMAPMFIAKEAWYFTEEWLDVETVFFSNPWDNNAALAVKDVQFSINPFTLAYLWQQQGTPMRIISNAWGNSIIEVIIQGNYDINTIEELATHVKSNPWSKLKIWTLKGDTLDMIIYRSFLEAWLSYDDFDMIWFNDLLAMVQSFKSQQIDILSHIRPYTTDLVLNYDGIVLTNNDIVWGDWTPNTTTIVLQDFLEKYPETIKAYLRAQKKGALLLESDPEAAVDMLVEGRYYQVDREILLFALQQHQQKSILLRPNQDWIMSAINDMISQWYIQPITQEIIDTSFLEQLNIN